jgi:hypothetical protein
MPAAIIRRACDEFISAFPDSVRIPGGNCKL